VNGLLASFATVAAVSAISGSLRGIRSNYVSLLVGVFAWTVQGLVTVWQLVGIWRSASRRGVDGKASPWAGLAKVGVVLGCLGAVASFVGQGIPALGAALDQARWLDRFAKWDVRLLREGTELELSGGIGNGFAADLERTLDSNPSVRLVHVNLAAGGLLEEARAARTVLRSRDLSTYVSRECDSACTYVFLGGTQRYLKEGAKLGFHAPSNPLAIGYAAEKVREGERRFLVDAGVSPSFSARATRTPTESMWYPSSEELVEAGVVTQVTTGDSFAMSGGPVPSLDEFRASLDKVRLYRALKAADPVVFEKALHAMHEAVLRGKSVAELRTAALPLLQPVYLESLPNASDEAVLEFGRLIVAGLAELQKAPPRACLGYVSASPDPELREEALRHLSKSVKARELDVMALVIESASPGRPRASEAQQAALFPKIFEHAYGLVGDDIQALQDLADPDLDPAKGCRAVHALYSGVMTLPPEDAASMLRFMMAAP
jgi:hypothetical protein